MLGLKIHTLPKLKNPNIIQPKTSQTILVKLLELLKIKPLDMKDLEEEEEKRKKFMEQQMNYMDGLTRKDKQPGIA
jgi:proteasome assembly chaperone (PAC2) family protein